MPDALVDGLWSLLRVSQAIHASPTLEGQLPVILDAAMELTGAHVALLALRNEQGGIDVVGERYGPQVKHGDGGKFSRSIIHDVITENQARFVLDTKEAPDMTERESVQRLQLRAVMAAPLQSRRGLFGVLYVHSKAPVATFTEQQRDVFLALRAMAAVAMDNAKQLSTLTVDKSTQLYTYSYGAALLAEEAAMAQRRGQQVSLVLVAIESASHFVTRDEVAAVAHAVKAAVRRVDFVVRQYRTQLAVIVPDSSQAALDTFAQKLRAQRLPSGVSLRLGVATGNAPDVLENAAEVALFHARG